jgi:hypothetical protein
VSTNKRQRAIAKRLKRKSARDRLKARTRQEYNRIIRANRNSFIDTSSMMAAPVAIAMLASRITQQRSR